MKRTGLFVMFIFVFVSGIFAQGYKIGDTAADFKLKNVDGSYVSLADYPDAKGFIIVFTCNPCPYSQAYEDRIMKLDSVYKSQGFPVIAINPNDPEIQPADNFEAMQLRAKEKGFTFPYLVDEGQKVFPVYGAERTPHVYVLEKVSTGHVVRYIGAIDDNPEDASAVNNRYVADAVDTILMEGIIAVPYTKAIGCGIKIKKKDV